MHAKTLFAAAAFSLALAGTASAASAYGVWLRPSTGSQVRFYACGGKLCAKVVAVSDQKRKSEIGKFVMNGGVPSGTNVWKGTLIDTGTGKAYSGTVTLVSASALSVKGCVAAILCQTETWSRVK